MVDTSPDTRAADPPRPVLDVPFDGRVGGLQTTVMANTFWIVLCVCATILPSMISPFSMAT